ncbi:MAG TPA: hypothetical protein PK006_05605 [Saprospiraceae bacterium]|nr:hypothetical protein [Saprospiraceae bacterium]
MKKNPFLQLFSLLLYWSFANAQDHFKTELKLRLEGGYIYADLVTLEDYTFSSLQFGFMHNASEVEFISASSAVLPNFSTGSYNEVCSKHIRFSWYSATSVNVFFPKNTILFTLKYYEHIPSDNFICMMESPAPGNAPICDKYLREVTKLDLSGDLYIVDDVCAYFNIFNNAINIISSNEEITKSKISLSYSSDQITIEGLWIPQADQLIINSCSGTMHSKYAVTGNKMSVDVSTFSAGIYFVSLVKDSKIIRTEKFVVN